MSKVKRIMRAGRLRRVCTYSRATRYDNERARAEKKKASSMAQQKINDRLSVMQLAGIIALNFSDSKTAHFVTLTFDEAHYPKFAKASEYWNYCCKEADNYIKRLRRLARRRGQNPFTVYAPGLGDDGRWHIHVPIDGVTAEDIRDAWGRGNVDYHNLYTDKKYVSSKNWYSEADNVNPVAIAVYMVHNARCRQVGKHPWHASKNCLRPAFDKPVTIPDAESIEPPEGSEILDRGSTTTLYSSFEFIDYILPQQEASYEDLFPDAYIDI